MKVSDQILALFPQDKLMHYIVGGLIFAVTFLLMEWLMVGDRVIEYGIALSMVIIAAMVKDLVIDEVTEWLDIVATFAGGVSMLVYTALIL